MSTRKDSVFEKVIQELTCLENVYSTDVKIVYHPSCTIKKTLPLQNCSSQHLSYLLSAQVKRVEKRCICPMKCFLLADFNAEILPIR
jgi:hypothetical protein